MKELDAAAASAASNGPTPGAAGGSRVRTLADYSTARNNSLDHESSLFNIGDDLITSLKERGKKIGNIVDRQSGPDQLGFAETGLQTAGQIAGGATDVLGAAAKTAYHYLVPDKWQQGARRMGREILNTDIGQLGMDALHKGVEAWGEFEKAHPDAAADIGSVVNIASFIPIGEGINAAKGATTAAVDAVKAAPSTAVKLAKTAFQEGKNLKNGLKTGLFGDAARVAEKETVETAAKDAAAGSLKSKVLNPDLAAEAEAGVDTAGRDALQANRTAVQRAMGPSDIPEAAAPLAEQAGDASQVPFLENKGEKIGRYMREKFPNATKNVQGVIERRAPNISAQKAETAAYDALAPESQKAVRGGLLRRDVEAFTSANDKEKGILKDMVNAAEENTNNRGTTHPSDLVGKEMNRRISLLDQDRKTIGQALGEHVKGLKTKDIGGIEQVQQDVIKRLNEVPGLEGIKTKVGEGGKLELDFSDTAMSGSQTEGARKELQAIFDDMNGKTPYQLHRQRQELFEALGGKKAAQLQLTETQEQGMDAVREGIADSLERISPDYKALNAEYRNIITPLKEMRKFYKGTEGAAEDVLDAKAGLLARRLTSNVASAPELRRILDEIGTQLAKRGHDVSDVDLNKLQDFYNALNRYYDISKDTTFEGLIKSANANPTEFTPRGIAKKVIDVAAKNTYITKDTQRAAIRELLSIGQK